MIKCCICIDNAKNPLALPCGHVFCSDCLLGAVRSCVPQTTTQSCPTCRSHYSTVNINPAFVPSTFRPYLTPSIRRLYIDEVDSTTEPSPDSEETKRLENKLAALQATCNAYRHRIEFQSAATIGLMRFAKMASNYAMEMKKENDELRERLRLEQSTRTEPPQIVEIPPPFPKKRSREEFENEREVESSSIRHLPGHKKRRTIICH